MGRPLFHPCPNRPQLISLDWMMAAQSLLEPANIEPSCIQMDLIKSNVDQLAYPEAVTIGHHRHAVITDSVSSFPCGLEKSLISVSVRNFLVSLITHVHSLQNRVWRQFDAP